MGVVASQEQSKCQKEKKAAPEFRERRDPIDGFGVDRMDGEESGCGKGHLQLVSQQPKHREDGERAGDSKDDVADVKGSGMGPERGEEKSVGEHLERTIGACLEGGTGRAEAGIGREEPSQGSMGSEGGVEDDLLVVVPDEAIAEAIAVGN